jgi:hypothetical protein
VRGRTISTPIDLLRDVPDTAGRIVRGEGRATPHSPRRSNFTSQCIAGRAAFGPQRHHIGLARPRDDEAQPAEFGITLAERLALLW